MGTKSQFPGISEQTRPPLQFITITAPEQRKTKEFRRAIRSHATGWQHAQRRRPDQYSSCKQYADEEEVPSPHALTHYAVGDAFPEAWQKDVCRTLHHMVTLVNIDIAEIDGTGVKGSISNVLYPAVSSEQAALRAVVLFGSAHHTHLCNASYESLNFLQLKGMTLRSINAAVQEGVTSDAIITAVFNLATTEAMFGSPEVFHLHMMGLLGLVRARGGLDMLGIGGLVERCLIWIDSHGSHMNGMKPHFSSKDYSNSKIRTSAGHPSPSKKYFMTARSPGSSPLET
ncbi:hypothetical protein PRZ48_002637 [Zasmidium cellare]|uniref:Uncharacterized protein n=1 Tax=Zasmidium cellare TaxID=395010 RepID=A0ABR0EST6_ZASCE|nr:hypothetical protein PRZ48_002637 [Zasmidium cellare]